MKRILDVIGNLYAKASLQVGLLIVNLLVPVLVLFISIIEQYFSSYIFLFSFIPLLISVIFLLFKMIFIQHKVISFVTDFIIGLLIIPFFIFHILMFFSFSLLFIIEEYPTNDIGKYSKLRVANYFPKKIPKDVSDVKMHYNTGVLQAGTYMILYYKTDIDELEYYKNKYEYWKESFDEENKILIKYYDTPYEDGLSDDFVKYQIYADCGKLGDCNHGMDKHYAINYESKEIIFYYASW